MHASDGGRRRPTRKSASRTESREQRQLRQRRGERAFLFDKDLSSCLGEVEREEWELVQSLHGGDVCKAGLEYGVQCVDPGAKALWGRSAEEALATYRGWQMADFLCGQHASISVLDILAEGP
jgi:hypothetical protein